MHATDFTHSVFHRCKFWDWNTFLSRQVFEKYVGIYESKAPSFRVFDPRGGTRINFTWQLVKFAPITVEIKLVKPIKISHLPSKLRFSAKCSFFGQSLSRGHYQPTYQPPEGVYLLNVPLLCSYYIVASSVINYWTDHYGIMESLCYPKILPISILMKQLAEMFV